MLVPMYLDSPWIKDSPDAIRWGQKRSFSSDGKTYYQIQWEESWTKEEDLLHCSDLLASYRSNGKPKIEVLSQTNNQGGESLLFVKVTVPPPPLPHPSSNDNVDPSTSTSLAAAVQPSLLNTNSILDKVLMAVVPSCQKPFNKLDDDEDVKMVTYAQLQKVGFLVDDEEENNSNAATSPHTPASTMAAARDEQMESARQKMYTQIVPRGVGVTSGVAGGSGGKRCTIRRRQPLQLYKCGICGSEFVHRTHLKIHQRTHTGEKPYKCSFCGRAFAQKGNLHVHMKIHTGVKDFVCQFCNRAFITNAQLFVHMRTHTNPNRKRTHNTAIKAVPKTEEGETKGACKNQAVVQVMEHSDEEGLKEGRTSPIIPPVESRQLELISEGFESVENARSGSDKEEELICMEKSGVLRCNAPIVVPGLQRLKHLDLNGKQQREHEKPDQQPGHGGIRHPDLHLELDEAQEEQLPEQLRQQLREQQQQQQQQQEQSEQQQQQQQQQSEQQQQQQQQQQQHHHHQQPPPYQQQHDIPAPPEDIQEKQFQLEPERKNLLDHGPHLTREPEQAPCPASGMKSEAGATNLDTLVAVGSKLVQLVQCTINE